LISLRRGFQQGIAVFLFLRAKRRRNPPELFQHKSTDLKTIDIA